MLFGSGCPTDRGLLGAVASRIGAVRGDLIGVDILERGAGKAIDELVVELPHESLLPLMVNEVNEVDGVDVEDIRQIPGAPVDPRLDALETAAFLVERQEPADLLGALVAHAARDFEADWAAVIDPSAPHPLNSVGSMPPEAWVFAFVKGARASMGGKAGAASPADVAWADLSVASLVVVLGRDGRPFRTRERRQLSALARIADNRWVEIVTRTSGPTVPPGRPCPPDRHCVRLSSSLPASGPAEPAAAGSDIATRSRRPAAQGGVGEPSGASFCFRRPARRTITWWATTLLKRGATCWRGARVTRGLSGNWPPGVASPGRRWPIARLAGSFAPRVNPQAFHL